MTEPVYRWEPSTDVYKEKAAAAAQATDVQAELEQKLKELHESKLRKPWKQEKAPLGIRIFTWYYFLRAGIFGLLLIVLFSFPKSPPSGWLTDNIGSFLHLPGSKSAREARQKQIEQEAQAYAVPENAIVDYDYGFDPDTLRNVVTAYVLFNVGVAAVIGFMWWNRSWKVRWVTMFYAGALLAKVLINFVAGAASGVGSGIPPNQAPVVILALLFNGLIFLYLAFGYGVKEWFEPGS